MDIYDLHGEWCQIRSTAVGKPSFPPLALMLTVWTVKITDHDANGGGTGLFNGRGRHCNGTPLLETPHAVPRPAN
jgi:hypothetical protein